MQNNLPSADYTAAQENAKKTYDYLLRETGLRAAEFTHAVSNPEYPDDVTNTAQDNARAARQRLASYTGEILALEVNKREDLSFPPPLRAKLDAVSAVLDSKIPAGKNHADTRRAVLDVVDDYAQNRMLDNGSSHDHDALASRLSATAPSLYLYLQQRENGQAGRRPDALEVYNTTRLQYSDDEIADVRQQLFNESEADYLSNAFSRAQYTSVADRYGALYQALGATADDELFYPYDGAFQQRRAAELARIEDVVRELPEDPTLGRIRLEDAREADGLPRKSVNMRHIEILNADLDDRSSSANSLEGW